MIKRLTYNGYGFSMWLHSKPQLNEYYLMLGNYFISVNYMFHNGQGLSIHLPYFIFEYAYKGKLGWWFKNNYRYKIFGIKSKQF